MVAPPLLILPTDTDYRQHYEQHYCRAVIMTHDAIRVFFRPDRFSHAFYESPLRDGIKAKILSPDRAQRMNWIAATLTNPAADRFQGWDRDNARYEAIRCVSVVWEDFVVILHLSLNRDGALKANFVTCYRADNSIGKIRRSPIWTRQDCINALR
jgi:hypothetical protein